MIFGLPHKIVPATETIARAYHRRGHGAQKYFPREEFYSKKGVQFYK